MAEKSNLYMDTFNSYNRLQQELTFIEQKYAYLLNQRKITKKEDSEWFEELKKQLMEYWITTDREKIRRNGLIETLSRLKEEEIIDILNTFFWIENEEMPEEKSENLNNILLSSFLSDINHYKAVKNEMAAILSVEDKKAIINRMWKLVKEDLMKTLKTEESLYDFKEWKKLTYRWNKKFSKSRRKWLKDEGTTEANVHWFSSNELHEKFTTSILTFHEIEKLYQKYNYIFTMRDIKDTHTILKALRKWEMMLMTWDTWSWKTELSLLIANIYLDEIYKDRADRRNKKPILVTGNSDTDFSDLTVEKIITSKNAITDQNDAIFWTEQERTNTQDVLHYLLKNKEVKEEIKKAIENGEWTSEEKEKLKTDLENYDMFKYNIFTEFHLQWIVKAMENGVPLILDEINGIPPEVLLWLNHYFTRKVGEEITIWNGFNPIRIKKWFCIICTGNDKDENSRMARYQGRYGIDESLLNRMHRICKWYYNQTADSNDYVNRNIQLERDKDWQSEHYKSQLEYMNENELYGVILMLCFYDEDKDRLAKKLDKTKKINEISEATLLQKMVNTETVGFNLMKESFKDLSREQSKKKTFRDLRSLANFIHFVQWAYQGSILLSGEKLELNKSPFSMRQLVSIIRDWKSDTKSLRYHLYNKYIREIPIDNDDRYTIYRIAQEVWFIDKNWHINKSSESKKEITEILEKNNSEEYHKWAHTRDAHLEEINIDDNLLENNLIITKQDIYKEYFGEQFWNIDDSEFEQQIEEEKEKLREDSWVEIQEENIENVRERVAIILDDICEFLDKPDNTYIKKMEFSIYRTLIQICKKEEGSYVYFSQWSDDAVKKAEEILWKILENCQDGEDPEWLFNLVQELKAIE